MTGASRPSRRTGAGATLAGACLLGFSVAAALACAPAAGALGWRAAARAPGFPAAPHVAGTAGEAASGAAAGTAQTSFGLRAAPVDIVSLSARRPARSVLSAASELPSSYDLRSASPSRLSPVGDQGSLGTCWAFAVLGSLESNLLTADPGDASTFSEDNMVLTSGYFAGLGAAGLYAAGGNSLMATAYLARWAGPVAATADAYGDGITPSGLSAARHVQEVDYLPLRSGPTDDAAIKTAVMEHGAVYTGLYWDGSAGAGTWDAGTDAYYCATAATANHAVDIVGWDDDYPASDFATTPPGDGAFIVRNSWGAAWGQGGYFHVSYYDANLAGDDPLTVLDGTAVFIAPESTDDYTREYQYDQLGWTDSIGTGSTTAWFANVFTAAATEKIAAVSFYAATAGSSYTLYGGSSLSSLTPVGSGTIAFTGYHTVALSDDLPVTDGSPFVVAVRLITPGCITPVPIECPIRGYSTAATASPGQSYVSADGSSWQDLTSVAEYAEANVCLKAFAVAANDGKDTTAPHTSVSGADTSWHRAPVTLTFTATDGSVGSGVAETLFRVDQGAWQAGTTCTIAAQATHADDGRHVVSYRSVDAAGNEEAVSRVAVKIDTRPPVVSGVRAAEVRRGAAAAFCFTLDDAAPSSGLCRVVVVVRAAGGRRVAVWRPPAWHRCGGLVAARLTCGLAPGIYRFVVRAVDRAGNVSADSAPATLRVRPAEL